MHLCQLNRASFYRVTSSGITVRMSNRSPVPDEPLGHRGTHGRTHTHTHTHIRMYTCVHTSTVWSIECSLTHQLSRGANSVYDAAYAVGPLVGCHT